MNYETLGQRLRLSRERARLTQTEVAQLLEITPSALNQYESAKRRVDALTLEQLATLYGVPLRSLFGEESVLPDWQETLRLGTQKSSKTSKAKMGNLIEKVNALEKLYQQTKNNFTPSHSFPVSSFSKEQMAEIQTAIWAANQARAYYNLGMAPLINFRFFLEAQGYHIFYLPFGKEKNALIRVYFRHPNLGDIIALNSDKVDIFDSFQLAHELAHALYHSDHPAIFCNESDSHPLERFADDFALYFLIPDHALQDRLHTLQIRSVRHPEEIVHLSYYFGVHYEIMVRRLELERRIIGDLTSFTDQALPLARNLGYSPSPPLQTARVPVEQKFPRIFLELVYRAIADDQISLSRGAEILGISDLELEQHLDFDLENDLRSLSPKYCSSH